MRLGPSLSIRSLEEILPGQCSMQHDSDLAMLTDSRLERVFFSGVGGALLSNSVRSSWKLQVGSASLVIGSWGDVGA